jgi:hypothetical protein
MTNHQVGEPALGFADFMFTFAIDCQKIEVCGVSRKVIQILNDRISG